MTALVEENLPTRKTLLTRLKNWDDDEGWREFFNTFQLFHLHVVREWPVRKVSQKLHTNFARVYYAKHKVAALIKREVRRLETKGI